MALHWLIAVFVIGLKIKRIGLTGPATHPQQDAVSPPLGIFDQFVPKFVKRYADIGDATRQALRSYVDDVRSQSFPGKEHGYGD